MTKVVIADSGPLIALANSGVLPLLPDLFESIMITKAVANEVTFDLAKPGAKIIQTAIDAGTIEVIAVSNSEVLTELQSILDQGEAESIELARIREIPLIIDEKKGRSAAKKQNVVITGSGAVLVLLKRKGSVSQVKPLLEKMQQSGYQFSNDLINKILILAGE